MKKTFTLFATLCMLCAFLQAQTEFSRNDSEWSVEYHWKRFSEYRDAEYHYALSKDTLLMDDTWKVMCLDGIPIGALLEKEKKVWYHHFANEANFPSRILFYDFSKEKGDTIHFETTCRIHSCLASLQAHKAPYDITVRT